MASSFLIGDHPQRGALWAAVDPGARFLKPEVSNRRFSAYLAPFTNEADARAALIAAGAMHVEAEQRAKRARRG